MKRRGPEENGEKEGREETRKEGKRSFKRGFEERVFLELYSGEVPWKGKRGEGIQFEFKGMELERDSILLVASQPLV